MFCEPRLEIIVAPVPKTWCDATMSAAPMLSICSGRESWREKLVQTPSRRDREERQHDRDDDPDRDAETHERLAPAARPPHVRDRERQEHARPELRSDSRAEQPVPEPQASRQNRRHRSRGQRRRPEVEPRQHDRARAAAARPRRAPKAPAAAAGPKPSDATENASATSSAMPQAAISVSNARLYAWSSPFVDEDRRCGEDGQRARRIFDGEVAIRSVRRPRSRRRSARTPACP